MFVYVKMLCIMCCLLSYGVAYGEETAKEVDKQSKGVAASEDSENNVEQVSAKKQKDFVLPDGLVWETNNSDPVFADPRATKGGTHRAYIRAFPLTFRMVGPNSTNGFRTFLYDYNDRNLISSHPNTGNILPSLATHWAAAKDHRTVYYKLNLNARWSDGVPVSAEDFLFTLEFMRSPHIQAPWYNNYYTEEIAEVKVHARDVISVVSGKKHVKKLLIQNTSFSPIPRHFHKLDKDWVRKYNFKIPPTTGPYDLSRFKKGQFVEFSLNKDWWAKDLKYNKYRYNFHKKHYKVIRDDESVWQHFFKGELDLMGITIPQWWHEKATGKVFDMGYVKKLWFYTDAPMANNQVWLNKQRVHWQDKNVRHAFAHALNIEKVLKEVLRGDYERLHSQYVGYGEYSDPTIRAREYDVEKVKKLMMASGYVIGKNGVWSKDNQPLKISLLHAAPFHNDRLAILKEEALKAGFDIALMERDSTTAYKEIQQKSYDVLWIGWSFGRMPPPRYRQYWHSEESIKNSNNFTMTADPELDKLIDTYRDTFDEKTKQGLSRKILRYIHEDGSFIPGFHYPFNRVAYWRHIQLPEVPGTRLYGVRIDQVGWFDEKAKTELEKYKKEGKSFGPSVTIDKTYKPKEVKESKASEVQN